MKGTRKTTDPGRRKRIAIIGETSPVWVATFLAATAGGGVVKAVVSGEKKVKSIEIAPEVVDPDDIETLQDLVVAAVNEALSTANAEYEQAMGKVTGGMNLGGMF